ncbi:MAG: PAS domain S-box protein [Promethearchaeota archaeon]
MLNHNLNCLSLILKNISDAVISTDLRFNILNWNKSAEIIYGWESNEVIGKPLQTVLKGRYKHLIFDEIKEELYRKGFWEGKFIQDQRNGKSLIIFSSVCLITDNDKDIPCFLFINHDFSKLDKINKCSETSEKKFHMILENVNDMIAIFNQNFEFEYINKKVHEEILGYRKDDLIGKSVLFLIHPDDSRVTINKWRSSIKVGKRTTELRFRKKDGSYIWLEVRGMEFTDYNETIKIITISRDISERKYMEQKLIKSEEKYRFISENAKILICVLNQRFEFEYINEKAYLEVLGYSNDDMIGKVREDLVYSEDIKKVVKILRECIKGKNVVGEIRIKHKDGYYVWFEIRGKLFKDSDSDPKLMVISRDITDHKKVEIIQKEENNKLLELNKLKSDLITRISHELKTPLTSSYLGSQIILTDPNIKMDEKALNIVRTIHRGHIRLKSLIENLLDASRIESEKFKLIKQRVNINELINECLKDIIYSAKKRDINLNINTPKEIFLNLDKIRIEQVFINILSNAIKNTPIGGDVSLYVEEKSDFFDFHIKDTGIGITSEEKQRLFEKFGKIERYGKGLYLDTEGSGLGLYISQHIIKSHDGDILVESEGRNKGTTFIIRLPIK